MEQVWRQAERQKNPNPGLSANLQELTLHPGVRDGTIGLCCDLLHFEIQHGTWLTTLCLIHLSLGVFLANPYIR